MDFFPDPPDAPAEPQEQPQPVWLNPPEDVLPAVVPVELVLGQSPTTVVMLSGLRAFPTGLHMSLGIRIHGAVQRRDLSAEVFDGPYGHDMAPDWQAGRLKWGFELADGRRVTNVDPWPQQPNQDHSRPHGPDDGKWEPDRPVLSGGGGSSGGRSADRVYWLWPLPPPGRLRVVCQWPDQDIAITVQDLDSSLVQEAAARARPLWPSP